MTTCMDLIYYDYLVTQVLLDNGPVHTHTRKIVQKKNGKKEKKKEQKRKEKKKKKEKKEEKKS